MPGPAAGIGVFLIGLGAAVDWIRLDAVGLPPTAGVAVTSKSTLAVLGAEYLALPLVTSTVIFAAASYSMEDYDRKGAEVSEQGEEDQRFWTKLTHFAKGAWAKWYVRYPAYVLFAPFTLLAYVFWRLKILPLFVPLVVALVLRVFWSGTFLPHPKYRSAGRLPVTMPASTRRRPLGWALARMRLSAARTARSRCSLYRFKRRLASLSPPALRR